MPWNTDDVEKHKKGLTAKEKKRWVAIANSVREKCLEEGKSEKYCDETAVIQANGAAHIDHVSKTKGEYY